MRSPRSAIVVIGKKAERSKYFVVGQIGDSPFDTSAQTKIIDWHSTNKEASFLKASMGVFGWQLSLDSSTVHFKRRSGLD